ncbi:MAG: SpoIID/LytB domain-containing protein [Balneolaceae bacterium]
MANYLLPLLGWVFVYFSVAGGNLEINSERDNWLDLTTTDSIRVLILSDLSLNNLFIETRDSEIRISADDDSYKITNQFKPLLIRANRNAVKILNPSGDDADAGFITLESSTGSLTVMHSQFGKISYDGILEIRINKRSGKLQLINRVALDDYIASVVGSEMNFNEPEALKTQAVVSRSYALWTIQKNRNRIFDITDNEMNQMYLGKLHDKPANRLATESTKREILTWNNKLVLAAYSSTCGGVTNPNEMVWKGKSLPYLRPVNDNNSCSISPHYKWNYTLNKNQLFSLLSKNFDFNPVDISIESAEHNRVLSVRFTDKNNRLLKLSGNDFRMFVNKHFGPYSLKSSRYRFTQSNSVLEFNGEGFGHGVGLCQYGALGFAKMGWDYKRILNFYFNNVKVVDFNSIQNQKIALAN